MKKKFQVYYTVDNPTKSWKGGKGYISKDMAVKGLPGPAEDTLILVSVVLTSTRRYNIYTFRNQDHFLVQFSN